ncbi:MAG: hypothetical protein LBU92_02125 [Prevotellaceae bacterium]|nr:hypothetical protein [Prevotellaceae bacterium]
MSKGLSKENPTPQCFDRLSMTTRTPAVIASGFSEAISSQWFEIAALLVPRSSQ